MEDLIETTHRKHYELYRKQKLEEKGFDDGQDRYAKLYLYIYVCVRVCVRVCVCARVHAWVCTFLFCIFLSSFKFCS